MVEAPATFEQLMDAVNATLLELTPEMSDEEHAAALGLFRDAISVVAEHCDELPTFRAIDEALDRGSD